MKPLKSFLTEENLEDLATRSYFRYGKQIAKDGVFTVLDANTFNLKVRVQHKNGEARTVLLESTPKGLRWKCTCTSRKDLFCQHCVAVGLNSLK